MEDTKPPAGVNTGPAGVNSGPAGVNAGHKRTSADAELTEQPLERRPSLQQSLDYARQDYDQVIAERDDAHRTLADLNRQIQELTREMNKAVQQAVEAKKNEDYLLDQISQAIERDELERASARADKESARADKLQTQVTELYNHLDRKRAQIFAQRSEKKASYNQIGKMKEKIQTAGDEVNAKLEVERTIINGLQEQIKASERYIDNHKGLHGRTKEQLSELKNVEKVHLAMQEKVKELQKKAGEFEQQVSVFKSLLDAVPPLPEKF